MYRKNIMSKTTITKSDAYEATCIEKDIQRMINNKEPLTGTAEAIYTERKEGVLPMYNIRTDKFEIMADSMDKVSELHGLQREARRGERDYEKMTPEEQKKFNEKFPNNKHARDQKMGGDL